MSIENKSLRLTPANISQDCFFEFSNLNYNHDSFAANSAGHFSSSVFLPSSLNSSKYQDSFSSPPERLPSNADASITVRAGVQIITTQPNGFLVPAYPGGSTTPPPSLFSSIAKTSPLLKRSHRPEGTWRGSAISLSQPAAPFKESPTPFKELQTSETWQEILTQSTSGLYEPSSIHNLFTEPVPSLQFSQSSSELIHDSFLQLLSEDLQRLEELSLSQIDDTENNLFQLPSSSHHKNPPAKDELDVAEYASTQSSLHQQQDLLFSPITTRAMSLNTNPDLTAPMALSNCDATLLSQDSRGFKLAGSTGLTSENSAFAGGASRADDVFSRELSSLLDSPELNIGRVAELLASSQSPLVDINFAAPYSQATALYPEVPAQDMDETDNRARRIKEEAMYNENSLPPLSALPLSSGVGGRHFGAPVVLVHPEEFRNPSSFLKVYGDPLCGGKASGNNGNVTGGRNGNWSCQRCGNVNYPRRFRCNKCNESRNEEGDLLVTEYVQMVYQLHLRAYRKIGNRNKQPITFSNSEARHHDSNLRCNSRPKNIMSCPKTTLDQNRSFNKVKTAGDSAVLPVAHYINRNDHV